MTVAPENERLIGGRYALEKLIGEGATGEVWRARHTALQSLVAIKFLHGSAAFRESTRKRFLKEAQVAAHLNTRHAVQVFDFGVTEQGRPYLIMELLDGETLARRLVRKRRLAPAQTAHVLRLASRALERAHAMGIVHRDFKPENIFLGEDEEGNADVKVVDFGVAKLVGDLEEGRDDDDADSPSQSLSSIVSFTRTGATVGTPSYMSPEQAMGKPDIGPPADIWAMGVVAYECLTGVRPFRAPTLEALFERIAKRTYCPAHDMCPDLPEQFDEWFRTACDPKPHKRFADAALAATALHEALGIALNPRVLPDVDPGTSASPSMRAGVHGARSMPAGDSGDAHNSSGEHALSSRSSKPSALTRSSSPRAEQPAPVARIAFGALLAALVAIGVAAAWRWSKHEPPSDPASATSFAVPLVSVTASSLAPPAASSAAAMASAPLPASSDDAGPRAEAPVDADAGRSAKASGQGPTRRPPAATAGPEPPPATASAAPTATHVATSTPPQPSATATGPSSPFQLPDLGL